MRSFFLVTIVAMLILSGCGGESSAEPSSVTTVDSKSLTDTTEISSDEAAEVPGNASPDDALVVLLDADLSGPAAAIGMAISKGAQLAIDEINTAGGVLGRSLVLEHADHRGNPARGVDAIRDFAQREDALAVLGGVHTPVALAELPVIHETEMIYLGPWAAGTPVVTNGYEPNYVFRVSVRDAFAGQVLVRHAIDRGFTRLGLLLEQTGWGRSNEKALQQALAIGGHQPAVVEWFGWGAQDLTQEMQRLLNTGCDAVVLVANPSEGAAAIQSMHSLSPEQRVPIVSHWGIAAGGMDFYGSVESYLHDGIDLTFLQTVTFGNPEGKLAHLEQIYRQAYPDEDIIVGVPGVAHAYDLVHMLALAVTRAQSISGPDVQRSLEQLENIDGAVTFYEKPFDVIRHDALTPEHLTMCRFDAGGLVVEVP